MSAAVGEILHKLFYMYGFNPVGGPEPCPDLSVVLHTINTSVVMHVADGSATLWESFLLQITSKCAATNNNIVQAPFPSLSFVASITSGYLSQGAHSC